MENTIVLNEKIAMDFHNFAKSLPEYPNDYGAMRELRNDLMRICDITELEAFNILRGFHIKEYIERYENSKTTDVKIVEKSNAPKEIIDLLAAYEKNYIYSGPGSKMSDYAQQLIISNFFQDIIDGYVDTMGKKLCDRYKELIEQKKKMDELDFEFVDTGNCICDEDIRYALPEHLWRPEYVNQAIELVKKDISKQYIEWRSIPYIREYFESKVEMLIGSSENENN